MRDDFQKNTLVSIKESKLKLMAFCTSWSIPCMNQFSILENLSPLLPGIDIIKVNIDDINTDADKFNIQALPTLCLLSNGKEIKRFIGVQKLNTLVDVITIYLKKEKYNAY
ncbi:MAG: thioredoxin family protein [Candidatus Magnetomorum sp.]|nr:thioredoxin family protein [Candidatus Magnetomorum sp.]